MFIIGLDDGLLPHSRSRMIRKNGGRQGVLCGITGDGPGATLCRQISSMWGLYDSQIPSQFLGDIPEAVNEPESTGIDGAWRLFTLPAGRLPASSAAAEHHTGGGAAVPPRGRGETSDLGRGTVMDSRCATATKRWTCSLNPLGSSGWRFRWQNWKNLTARVKYKKLFGLLLNWQNFIGFGG